MTIYYIYEIPGVKVGCTKDLKRRMQQQKVWFSKQYKVLGAANNPQDASDLEREWQIKLGYKTDNNSYDVMLNKISKMNTPKAKAKRRANTDYTKRVINQEQRVKNTNWKEARTKAALATKKPVDQYDLQGNFIKRWDGKKDAAKALGLNHVCIGMCCNGKLNKSGGFIWKYAI